MKQVQDRSRARSKSAGRSASRAPEWKKDRETEKTVESIYLPTEEDAKINQEWQEPPKDWNDWKQYKTDINKKIYVLAKAWNANRDARLTRDHIWYQIQCLKYMIFLCKNSQDQIISLQHWEKYMQKRADEVQDGDRRKQHYVDCIQDYRRMLQ